MHKTKRFLFLIAVWLFVLCPQSSTAQYNGQCTAHRELIIKLRNPVYGTPTVWNSVYGTDEERFVMGSGVHLDGKTVLVAGAQLDNVSLKTKSLELIEINRRGRAIRVESFEPLENERFKKIIKHEKGFVVVSNVGSDQNRFVKISLVDAELQMLGSVEVDRETHNIEVMDLLAAHEGVDGFMVVLKATMKRDLSQSYSIVQAYGSDMKKKWERAYRIGTTNSMHTLKLAHDQGFITAGEIVVDSGRVAGWAVLLGHDGTILWQKTYRRGISSVLNDVVTIHSDDLPSRGFLFAGITVPTDGGTDSLWLMYLSSLGEVRWQRYVRSKGHDFFDGWIELYPDKRIMLMSNLRVRPDVDGENHFRLFTFSPRGILVGDEPHVRANGARISDYVPGPGGERILFSSIETMLGEKVKNTEENIRVLGLGAESRVKAEESSTAELDRLLGMDRFIGTETPDDSMPSKKNLEHEKGWVVFATALDPYNDPCRVSKR
jgi:hypothetical protein